MRASRTETVGQIEYLLDAEQETFYRLPAAHLTATPRIATALEDFRARQLPAGEAAAAWLRESVLREHMTARTVLLLGHGRVLGFYALASTAVAMDEEERAAAGVASDRRQVPATLLCWMARDPAAELTGRELCLHAIASCRQANQVQATAVMVLDAFDDATEQMWLDRSLGLRKLRSSERRLWIPLTAD